jgi:hypothetical protein
MAIVIPLVRNVAKYVIFSLNGLDCGVHAVTTDSECKLKYKDKWRARKKIQAYKLLQTNR